jgi:Ca-activated chloride channel family protein
MVRIRSERASLILLSSILFLTAQALSQSSPAVESHSSNSGITPLESSVDTHLKPASLRVAVDLVLVPVTVTDALNHPQTDLTRDDFTLYEGNQAQKIRYFSAEDSPISVGLLLDVSKSMLDKIDTERFAVDQFFRNANPQDDYFVVTFNYGPRVLSDVTQSTAGIESELGLLQPSGSTALLDAIYLGVAKLRNAQYSRRALVIISDGGDNSSRYKLKEIKNLVAESDVMVYALGIFDKTPFKTFEEAMGKRWLSSITDVTGGRTLTVDNLDKLPETSALLSRELRSQYVLGYESSDKSIDGKWRKIRVAVDRSSEAGPLRPYYRKGYYGARP